MSKELHDNDTIIGRGMDKTSIIKNREKPCRKCGKLAVLFYIDSHEDLGWCADCIQDGMKK